MNLRSLIKYILLENVPLRLITLSDDDIDASFVEGGQTRTLNGIKMFAPFHLNKEFTSYTEISKLGKAYMFNPDAIAAFLKKGEQPKSGRVIFKMSNDLLDVLLYERMARDIAARFRNSAIKEVMLIDSSHLMADILARLVATYLNVPFYRTLHKQLDPNSVDWDHDEFDKWARDVAPNSASNNGVSLDSYIENVRSRLKLDKRSIVNKLKRGIDKTSIARDIPQFRRRFWNLFAEVEHGSYRVLVIDDNVSSGWTGYHADKRLRAAGLEPLFAAGFFYNV